MGRKAAPETGPDRPAAGSQGGTPPPDGGTVVDAELAAAIREVNRCGRDPVAEVLGPHWELGRLIEARVGVEGGSTPGAGGRRPGSLALARRLGVEVGRLKAARWIYRAFPGEEGRARLLAIRRADGSLLPFWAVARLCSPALTDERSSLLERACRECWTEYDVKDKLRASRGGDPVARSGGRKHKPARSLPLALARWEREADGLIRSVEAASRPEAVAELLASPDASGVAAHRVGEVRRAVVRSRAALLARLRMLDQVAAGLPGPDPATPADPGAGRGARKTRRDG